MFSVKFFLLVLLLLVIKLQNCTSTLPEVASSSWSWPCFNSYTHFFILGLFFFFASKKQGSCLGLKSRKKISRPSERCFYWKSRVSQTTVEIRAMQNPRKVTLLQPFDWRRASSSPQEAPKTHQHFTLVGPTKGLPELSFAQFAEERLY